MSRSFKKPYYTDQQKGNTTRIKRIANKAVRKIKIEDCPQNGKSYQKVFESWNIRDWSFHSPKDKKAYRK